MEQVKKLESKFKVGDTVYYYDFIFESVIKKDEIVRIEYDNRSNVIYYYFKNPNAAYGEETLYKTFEECKACTISYYESLLRSFQSRPVKDQCTELGIKNCNYRLENIKAQEEAL